MSIKLIAVDMDGTFLSDAKTYNRQRFLAQYARMREQGIRFVVASGNQYYQLISFFPEVAHEIAFVAENGGWVVGYFAANSSQLVHPVGREWVLTDHYTAHRGRGEAGAFRRHVFAHLAREADLHGVGIRLDTRVPKLADLYVRDMPGLELTATRRSRFATVYSFARSPRSVEGS